MTKTNGKPGDIRIFFWCVDLIKFKFDIVVFINKLSVILGQFR